MDIISCVHVHNSACGVGLMYVGTAPRRLFLAPRSIRRKHVQLFQISRAIAGLPLRSQEQWVVDKRHEGKSQDSRRSQKERQNHNKVLKNKSETTTSSRTNLSSCFTTTIHKLLLQQQRQEELKITTTIFSPRRPSRSTRVPSSGSE